MPAAIHAWIFRWRPLQFLPVGIRPHMARWRLLHFPPAGIHTRRDPHLDAAFASVEFMLVCPVDALYNSRLHDP